MDEIRASNRGRLKFGGVVGEASRFTSLKLRKPRRVAHLRKLFSGVRWWARTKTLRIAGAKSTNLYRQVEIVCFRRLFV
jgi:hypothetical protein